MTPSTATPTAAGPGTDPAADTVAPQVAGPAAGPVAQPAEPVLVEADLLVEDVSIDGMCGVY